MADVCANCDGYGYVNGEICCWCGGDGFDLRENDDEEVK